MAMSRTPRPTRWPFTGSQTVRASRATEKCFCGSVISTKSNVATGSGVLRTARSPSHRAICSPLPRSTRCGRARSSKTWPAPTPATTARRPRMQTGTGLEQPNFYESAPMALDRSVGWRYVRERGEVFEADGMWYLTSLEAVRFAQHHPEIFSSAGGYDIGSPIPMVPLMIDPPDHAGYRRLLDPMLSPRVVNGLQDNLRSQAAQLVEPLVGQGQCDIITDIAELFPTQVLLTLFGLPVADRDKFRKWSDVLTSDA